MSVIDNLVTDRTQADVDRVTYLQSKTMTASEWQEYLLGMKGSYNATDLNRVGEAVAYVAQRLNQYGGFALNPTAKQDWQIGDIPTAAQMLSYIQDLNDIKSCYPYQYQPTPASMNNLTYDKANDIEIIIIAVDEALRNVIATFVPCGMVHSGMIWEEFI